MRVPDVATLCAALVLTGLAVGCPGACGAEAETPPLEEAAALWAEGRFDEALDTLRTESRSIKEAEGEDAPGLLPINDLAAEILIDRGDLTTAAALLEKTILAREQLVAAGGAEQAVALGASWLSRARLETTAKRLPAALAAAKRALLILDGASPRDAAAVARAQTALQTATDELDEMVGAGSDTSVEARNEVAVVLTSLGMIPEAIAQRQKTLAGLMEQREVDATAVLQATEQLSRLMMVNGRAEEAIPVVEMTLPRLGAVTTPQAIAAQRLLGELYLATGKLALAEATFADVLEAVQKDAKPSPFVLASDRLRSLLVAVRQRTVNRLPDWFDAAQRLLSRPGPGDMAVAMPGLVLAAAVKQEMGDLAGAVELLGRGLTLANAMKPPDGGLIAEFSGRLAAAQIAAGNAAMARKTAKPALPAAERSVGPGSAEVGFLRIALADALARSETKSETQGGAQAGTQAGTQTGTQTGTQSEAVALVTTACRRGLPRPDDSWEAMATEMCDRLASDDNACELREKYLAARARQFGANHPHVVSACGLFGAARLAAGDWTAAADFFERALDLDSNDESPETAANLVLLARAYQAAGEPTRALETARRGLVAWEKVAGADHPGTLDAADTLVSAKLQAGDAEGVTELLERLCATDAIDDPSRRAAHLVRLADLTVAQDKRRSQDLLRKALQLPCWQDGFDRGAAANQRLAFTAAVAAHAATAAGDSTTATQMLQRARRLVMESEDSTALLERIERVAARGGRP
jgi:tetratricopeptide (TPR) repeat protein